MATVLASELNRVLTFERLEQVLNDTLLPGHKWFSLGNNTLDGSYHPFDTAGNQQVGWWGSSLSDANGEFISETSNPPTLMVMEERTIHALRIVGDAALHEFPVDFMILLFNGEELVHVEVVVGNPNVVWERALPEIIEVTNYGVIVSKLNKPNSTVKLVSAFNPFSVARADTLEATVVPVVDIDTSRVHADDLVAFTTETSLVTVYPVSADILLGDMKIMVTKYLLAYDVTNSAIREQKAITVYLNSADTTYINASEQSAVHNIHTVMDSPFRQVFAKVEVTYTDPFVDTTIDIEANSEAYNTNVHQLADSAETSAFKWFSLPDNTLDGSFGLIDGSKRISAGWWSTAIANASGRFSTNPLVTMYFSPRAVHMLKVVGDSLLENYPVEFTIRAYNATDTLVLTKAVTGNTNVVWIEQIETILNIAKLTLEIKQINKPLTNAKLTEFYTGITETYYNDRLINLDLLEELAYDSGTAALGAVSSNEIDVMFNNADGKFNINDPNIPLYGLLKRNRRVRAWLGAEVVPPEIEWYPLGTFWTTQWTVPYQSLVASIVARDRLELLRVTDYTTSLVYENKSLYWLFEEVLLSAGLSNTGYYIAESLKDIIIPYAWFDRTTHRDALHRLASGSYVNVYCDRMGVVCVTPMETEIRSYYTLKDSKNIISREYPTNPSDLINQVDIATKKIVLLPEETLLDIDTPISVLAHSSITLEYSFYKKPAKNVKPPIVVGSSISVEYTAYAWGIRITLTNATAVDRVVESITVAGQPLDVLTSAHMVVQNSALIADNGKIALNVEHDFIQDPGYAYWLAGELLLLHSQAARDVILQTRGNIGVYAGHKVEVEEPQPVELTPYILQQQQLSWDGSLSATITCKKV